MPRTPWLSGYPKASNSISRRDAEAQRKSRGFPLRLCVSG